MQSTDYLFFIYGSKYVGLCLVQSLAFIFLKSFIVGIQLVAMVFEIGLSSGSRVAAGVTFIFRIVRVTLIGFVVIVGLALRVYKNP